MENRFILTPYFIDTPLPGLVRTAREGWEIYQTGLPEAPAQARLSALYPGLADRVAAAASAGDRPISVAGDCCTALAVLAGLQRSGIDPLLIWFDAHGDFNTWETTPSGFLGGMPLAMLAGLGEQTVCEAVGLRPLPERQVILTDARDLDPGEREAVLGSAVIHLEQVEALRSHPLGDRPIWVHFDTDVLDPADAPAMNYPTPGGPRAEALGAVFERIQASGRLAAVSISTWNPELDPDRRTERVVMGVLEKLVGEP